MDANVGAHRPARVAGVAPASAAYMTEFSKEQRDDRSIQREGGQVALTLSRSGSRPR